MAPSISLGRETGIRDGETRGFRRHHALGMVLLRAGDDAEADDGIFSRRCMLGHCSFPPLRLLYQFLAMPIQIMEQSF